MHKTSKQLRATFLEDKKWYGYETEKSVMFSTQAQFQKAWVDAYLDKHPECELIDLNREAVLYNVSIKHSHLMSICPFRNVADVSLLHVTYTPNKHILELAAFKNLLATLISFAVTHEAICATVTNIIRTKVKPKKLSVMLDASPFLGMEVIINS